MRQSGYRCSLDGMVIRVLGRAAWGVDDAKMQLLEELLLAVIL